MEEYLFRKAEIGDAEAIYHLENELFVSPSTVYMLKNFIKDDIYDYFIAETLDGAFLGYSGMMTVLDEGSVINIAVNEKYRRTGIGSGLLEKLIENSIDRGLLSLTLEVRESNEPALKMYEKYGFVIEGIRKNYYSSPKENALICTKYMRKEEIN